MGCAASKAPPKRDPVEELIEEVHAQQGRESGGGVTLDLSAAPATPDAPAGKLAELGLSLNGKVPDAAWACVGVTTLSLKGNHLGSLSPKLGEGAGQDRCFRRDDHGERRLGPGVALPAWSQ